MSVEYDTLVKMNTFTVVDRPYNINVLPCKWVFKHKDNGLFKSRLVPLGCNEIAGIDYSDTYAPVSKHTSIRMLLSISAMNNLDIHQMDITNAFPNALLKENIYMSAIPGYPLGSNKVLKLNKALYGLKQSPKEWNTLMNDFIISLKFVQCNDDKYIYMLK